MLYCKKEINETRKSKWAKLWSINQCLCEFECEQLHMYVMYPHNCTILVCGDVHMITARVYSSCHCCLLLRSDCAFEFSTFFVWVFFYICKFYLLPKSGYLVRCRWQMSANGITSCGVPAIKVTYLLWSNLLRSY